MTRAGRTTLFEDALPIVLVDPRLKGDQFHPNAASHALLATKRHEALRKIGYAR